MATPLPTRPLRTALAVVLLLVAGGALAATPDPAGARRLLTLLAGVRDEYGEAVDAEGRVVVPREIDEARLLLADARDQLARLGDGVGADAVSALEGIARAVAARVPPAEVEEQVDALRLTIGAAANIATDSPPPAPPSIEHGQALFAENCSGCHGARGAGDGEEARHLAIRPANFTDPTFMRAETPQDFFNVVTLGRRRSGMPAWGEALSTQQRWDLVRYIWSLAHEGQGGAADRVYGEACAGCHGGNAAGGHGAPDVSTTLSLARTSDADLLAALAAPAHPVAHLAPADAALAVYALRDRSLAGGAAPGTAEPEEAPGGSLAGLDDASRLLEQAVAAAAAGDAAAGQLATDAYIAFEPFERRLRVLDAGGTQRIEDAFLELRTRLRANAPADEIAALGARIGSDLARVRLRLGQPSVMDRSLLFGQAATIILREGFEIILIVGALAAYVRRSGQASMLRAIRAGVVAGVAASVATAAALVGVLRETPWASEALEGAALLVAAVVLFWVSYWLVAKSEADRWQHYIRGKVQAAMVRGSGLALAGAAFIAVYREGFETVLFYQALFAGNPGGATTAAAGFGAGALALAVLWIALARIGMRIPLARFFLVTGALLYAMAIIFAGQGVAELQEAAVLPITPVAWGWRLPALGVFPTRETMAAQGVFVALLLLAIGVAVRRRRARRGAEPIAPPSLRDGTSGI